MGHPLLEERLKDALCTELKIVAVTNTLFVEAAYHNAREMFFQHTYKRSGEDENLSFKVNITYDNGEIKSVSLEEEIGRNILSRIRIMANLPLPPLIRESGADKVWNKGNIELSISMKKEDMLENGVEETDPNYRYGYRAWYSVAFEKETGVDVSCNVRVDKISIIRAKKYLSDEESRRYIELLLKNIETPWVNALTPEEDKFCEQINRKLKDYKEVYETVKGLYERNKKNAKPAL